MVNKRIPPIASHRTAPPPVPAAAPSASAERTRARRDEAVNRSNDSLLGEWGLTKRQSRLAVAGIGLTVATGVLGILTGAAGLLTPTPLGVVAFPLMVILAVSTVLTATAAMLAGGGLFVTSMLEIRKGLKGKQGAEAEEMGRFLKNYDIHEPSHLEVIKESIKSVVGGLYQRIFG